MISGARPQSHELTSLAADIAASWDKGPRVFRDVLPEPLFDATDVSTAIDAGIRASRDGGSGDIRSRIFLGQSPLQAWDPRFSAAAPPTPRATISAYEAMLAERFPGERLGIIVDECLEVMPRGREALTSLLDDVFAVVGYPLRTVHACLYTGTYRTTPFGIHVDDCHVLMASGLAEKSMAFWPREHFEAHPDLSRTKTKNVVPTPVEQHLAAATVLSIGPRDLLYWPPGVWHVGVDTGDAFHSALSVGIYHRGAVENVLHATAPWPPDVPVNDPTGFKAFDALALKGYPLSPAVHDTGRIDVGDIPAQLRSEYRLRWNQMVDTLTRPAEPEMRLLGHLLERATSAGLGGRPGSVVPELAFHTIRCPRPRAIAFARINWTLLVGANGVVRHYTDRLDRIEALLVELRSGRAIAVEPLLQPLEPEERTALLAVMRDLTAAGAIVH